MSWSTVADAGAGPRTSPPEVPRGPANALRVLLDRRRGRSAW